MVDPHATKEVLPTAFPKITFGVIVLNGEPFTRYCLGGLYPFAHEIIVVEGACKSAAAMATVDGHSSDGTLESLRRFKREEDPEKKVQIITRDGFWCEKDEQSQAYAERATGDYVWQVDIDEFYHPEAIRTLLRMLAENSAISGVSFRWINFWGGFDFTVDGWQYRDLVNRIGGNRRIFRWGKGYRYVSHRPPRVIDDLGRDLFSLNWVGPDATAKEGLFCYHYGMIFPKQARQKSLYYQALLPSCGDMESWYQESYLNLRRPFRVLHGIRPPSWLRAFHGSHPPEIKQLRDDMERGILKIERRRVDDITRLVQCRVYRVAVLLLEFLWFGVKPLLALGRSMKGRRPSFRRIKLLGILSGWRYFPLEDLQDAPDLFRVFGKLYRRDDLQRKPGGWIYRGLFYPDYLTVGGASHAIFREALKFCRGRGIDVGAGHWPFPGATPVDLTFGTGSNRKLDEFPEQSLDYVFSSHCLEHIEHWETALVHWLKKLKSGGTIFLYLPHPDCAIWHPGSPFVGDGHKWIPRPEIIKEALQRWGCELVQWDDGPDAMWSFYVCACKKNQP